MPNKANIDEHISKRVPGATQGSVTASGCTIGGTLDEGSLLNLIRTVNGTGGSITLVAGVLTVKY